ncbi:MAG: zinc ABC transporter substrate-binding protein [Chloroflexi bacterium]|nr:zinc ABC transporter substrate-binding protein [Chloroflexota bacterium]
MIHRISSKKGHGVEALFGLAALGGLFLLAAACTGGGANNASPTPTATARLSAVTTIYPLEYFTRRVGGDMVSVVNLVPPGVEAHDFEPSPSDIARIRSADLVVYNGGGFEPWIDRALKSSTNPGRIVVEAAHHEEEDGEGHGEEEHEDPHLWLDPLEAIEMVERIVTGLAQARPADVQALEANGEALAQELNALHGRYLAGLAECRQTVFAVSHAAFGHMAERYGLEQVAITGITPEAEPSPGQLAAIADRLRGLGVKYVLVEPILSPALSQTIAKEIGADLLPLHPLESLTPAEAQRGETFLTIMDANLANLRTALECTS